MASYNRVILVGNVTRDIELKYTQGGTAVTDVGMAVTLQIARATEPYRMQLLLRRRDPQYGDVFVRGCSNQFRRPC